MKSFPNYQDFLWPTLKILEAKGGSATIEEILSQLPVQMGLDEQMSERLHKNGSVTELAYRAGWARTYLKKMGAVTNPKRGIWTITPIGRGFRAEETVKDRSKQLVQKWAAERIQQQKQQTPEASEPDEASDKWKTQLLDIIHKMSPDAFERLCQRLLRESGFIKVEVTGKSGDEGIDGKGILKINLLSYHVRFQCKRYKDSVGASSIRDFRGSLDGRQAKGLFITSGRFTQNAQNEAVRDGAIAIDLIDGDQLCDLLKQYNLGVETIEIGQPIPEYFQEL